MLARTASAFARSAKAFKGSRTVMPSLSMVRFQTNLVSDSDQRVVLKQFNVEDPYKTRGSDNELAPRVS